MDIFTSFSEPLLVCRLEKTELGSWEDTHWHPREPWSLQIREGGRCPSQKESGLHPGTTSLPQRGPCGGARLQDTPGVAWGQFKGRGQSCTLAGAVLGAAGPREVLALARLLWVGQSWSTLTLNGEAGHLQSVVYLPR